MASGVRNHYDIEEKVLGKGKFAEVKRAIDKKTKEPFAVKVITKDKIKSGDQSKLKTEIDIMKKVSHPNCVSFTEVYESRTKLYIIMELVTGGELFDRIIEKEHYSEKEAAACFQQVIEAIDYLHSIGIVHRDLKPENILYKDKSEDSLVKVADFGLGAMLDLDPTSGSAALKTVCGTPSYVAPEVLERTGYGMEVDIWSSGIVLYILLCGFPPFDQEAHTSVLFDRIKKGKYSFPDPYWTPISKEAKDLVKGMMTVDPTKRLTTQQCLQHPWLAMFKKGSISDQPLPQMQDELKKYNAARKFKGAIHTLSALQRMVSGKTAKMPTLEQAADVLKQVQGDPERLSELKESFDLLDRDKSGIIDTVNLTDTIGSLGHKRTENEIENMIQRFDVNKTGHITFDEFCIVMGPAKHGIELAVSSEKAMKATFNAFDFLGTGVITPMELKEVLRRLGAEASDDDVASMVAIADTNGDGVIDFEEFKKLMSTRFQS